MLAGIYSQNLDYVYKIRQIVRDYGFDLQYLSNIPELMDFILLNKDYRLFIDGKNLDFIPQIQEYIKRQPKSKLIVLADNNQCDLDCDNINSYMVTLSTIKEKLPDIIINKDNSLCHFDNAELEASIIDCLSKYGIATKHTGYEYLKEGIHLAVKSSSKMIIKDIYSTIGEINHTKPTNVEKCIRESIKKAFTHLPEDFCCKEFHINNITNSTFISHIANTIQLSYLKKQSVENINS